MFIFGHASNPFIRVDGLWAGGSTSSGGGYLDVVGGLVGVLYYGLGFLVLQTSTAGGIMDG